jgi:hypothetical protein
VRIDWKVDEGLCISSARAVFVLVAFSDKSGRGDVLVCTKHHSLLHQSDVMAHERLWKPSKYCLKCEDFHRILSSPCRLER